MLEPTLLILLSIFAGFIVVSIYLPIFTMYDLM
jgi:type IV pilus assembly protein PilC